MKTKMLILCGALLLAAGVRGQQPHPESDPVGENLFPPELIMQNQKAIGLDEAQKSYIRTEITKTQGRFSDLQWQLQDAMESLGGLLKQDVADEQQVLAQLDKVLNLEKSNKPGYESFEVTPGETERLSASRRARRGNFDSARPRHYSRSRCSIGAATILRTRSRSAGTSSLDIPFVSMVPCR